MDLSDIVLFIETAEKIKSQLNWCLSACIYLQKQGSDSEKVSKKILIEEFQKELLNAGTWMKKMSKAENRKILNSWTYTYFNSKNINLQDKNGKIKYEITSKNLCFKTNVNLSYIVQEEPTPNPNIKVYSPLTEIVLDKTINGFYSFFIEQGMSSDEKRQNKYAIQEDCQKQELFNMVKVNFVETAKIVL